MRKDLCQVLSAAMARKEVTFEWRKQDKALAQRLAHRFARDGAKGLVHGQYGPRVPSA
jgi:hypothetical protein